jgi:hypothetical protein
MNVVKMQHTRQFGRALLFISLLLSSSIFFLAKPVEATGEAATIKIISPLSNDNKFSFNSTDHPVNSTFTVDFYIANSIRIAGWQILIRWNNTVIHFQIGWIPDDNVFAPAIDQGATLIAPRPSLDIINNDTYSLLYGASILPVTSGIEVTGQALLCKLNFTIAAAPQENSQIFTNIELIGQAGGEQSSLDSYVVVPYTSSGQTFVKTVKVFAEPAIVRILGAASTFHVITDVAIASLIVSPTTLEVGDSADIVILLKNVGNDLETFNVTIETNQMIFAEFSQTLGAFQNVTYRYSWNSSGVLLDTPVQVTIFGIPIVISHETHCVFSVDLILPGDMNQTNNHAEVDLPIHAKLGGADLIGWLILLWLGSPIGQLLLGYTIIFAAFLVTLSLHRRLRSPKHQPPPKAQVAEKLDTTST